VLREVRAMDAQEIKIEEALEMYSSVLIDKYMRFSAGVSAEDFGGGQDGCCDRLDAERAART
jgi:hypothetical protein